MGSLPKNVIVRQVLVTDLAQQLKKKRDFLKWMARRYLEVNPEQSAAFTTGAEQLNDIRNELLEGLFDLDPKEELIPEAPGSSSSQVKSLEELNDQVKYPPAGMDLEHVVAKSKKILAGED